MRKVKLLRGMRGLVGYGAEPKASRMVIAWTTAAPVPNTNAENSVSAPNPVIGATADMTIRPTEIMKCKI